jgi:hypothetical protein
MSRRRRRKNELLEGEVQTDKVHLNFRSSKMRWLDLVCAEADKWLLCEEYQISVQYWNEIIRPQGVEGYS